MTDGRHSTAGAPPVVAPADGVRQPGAGRFGCTGHLLADAYHLMAHDDVTGRPRGSAVATALGVAAALLCEYAEQGLVAIRGAAAVTGYGAHVLGTARPVDASLPAIQLLELAALGLPAEELVRELARGQRVQRWVRDRLVADTTLTARTTRLWQRTVYVPADANAAWWPGVLLIRQLTNGEPIGAGAAALAGIAAVTGLLGRVSSSSAKAAAERAYRERARLPAGLAAIVTAAEIAIGSAAESPL